MNFKISKQQLVNQIFNALDSKDQVKGDHKIEKETWNVFAQMANGNTIKNVILEKNAKGSISEYLSRGDEVVSKLLAFCNIDMVDLTGESPKKSNNVTPAENTKPIEDIVSDNQEIIENNKPDNETVSADDNVPTVDTKSENNTIPVNDTKQNDVIPVDDTNSIETITQSVTDIDVNETEDAPQISSVDNSVSEEPERNVGTETEEPIYSQEFYNEVCTILDKIPQKYRGKNREIDNDYWAPKIAKLSTKYNIKPEVIATIIGREVHYVKQEGKLLRGGSVGPMQIATITIKDMLQRKKMYMDLDSQLTEEVLYPNGPEQPLSIKEMRQKCIDDCEYGMKVGILCYKMKEYNALRVYYPKVNSTELAQNLEDYTSKLTENQRKSMQKASFRRYNGSDAKEEYANACMWIYDSIGGKF